jgi:hypothetical protein
MAIRRHTSRSTVSISNRVNSANLALTLSAFPDPTLSYLVVAGGGGGGTCLLLAGGQARAQAGRQATRARRVRLGVGSARWIEGHACRRRVRRGLVRRRGRAPAAGERGQERLAGVRRRGVAAQHRGPGTAHGVLRVLVARG